MVGCYTDCFGAILQMKELTVGIEERLMGIVRQIASKYSLEDIEIECNWTVCTELVFIGGLEYNEQMANSIAFLVEVLAAESILAGLVEGFEMVGFAERLLTRLEM